MFITPAGKGRKTIRKPGYIAALEPLVPAIRPGTTFAGGIPASRRFPANSLYQYGTYSVKAGIAGP